MFQYLGPEVYFFPMGNYFIGLCPKLGRQAEIDQELLIGLGYALEPVNHQGLR